MTTANRLGLWEKEYFKFKQTSTKKMTQRHQPLYPDSKLPKSARNAELLTLLQVETHPILRRARRKCHFCSLPDSLSALRHLMAGHLGSCVWIMAVQSCGFAFWKSGTGFPGCTMLPSLNLMISLLNESPPTRLLFRVARCSKKSISIKPEGDLPAQIQQKVVNPTFTKAQVGQIH